MSAWAKADPQWLAKDVVVVFYDDSSSIGGEQVIGENYANSLTQFLHWYHLGNDGADWNVAQLLDPRRKIHGRCGSLRQGFPFVFKDYNFNRFALHVEGINAKLSDVDHIDGIRGALSALGF